MPNSDILYPALALAALGYIILKAIAYGRECERQKYLKQEAKENEKVDQTINNNSTVSRDNLLLWLLDIQTKKR